MVTAQVAEATAELVVLLDKMELVLVDQEMLEEILRYLE
jgi:hypothetical protein